MQIRGKPDWQKGRENLLTSKFSCQVLMDMVLSELSSPSSSSPSSHHTLQSTISVSGLIAVSPGLSCTGEPSTPEEPHQCWAERGDLLPWHDGDALPNAAQEAAGLFATSLAHGDLPEPPGLDPGHPSLGVPAGEGAGGPRGPCQPQLFCQPVKSPPLIHSPSLPFAGLPPSASTSPAACCLCQLCRWPHVNPPLEALIRFPAPSRINQAEGRLGTGLSLYYLRAPWRTGQDFGGSTRMWGNPCVRLAFLWVSAQKSLQNPP